MVWWGRGVMVLLLLLQQLLLLALGDAQVDTGQPTNSSMPFPAVECRTMVANPGDFKECWLARAAVWKQDTEMKMAKRRVRLLMQGRTLPKSNSPTDTVVYIHAFMIESDPSNGISILRNILDSVSSSGLMKSALGVYVVGFGPVDHIRSFLDSAGAAYNRVTFISDVHDLGSFYEFPTLALMQQHARHMHRGAKVLYLHTKGVTHKGDPLKAYDREAMLMFCVTLFEQSLRLIDNGWLATGITDIVATNKLYYDGNFFWLKAGAAARHVDVLDLVWHWRFGAEKWPLNNLPPCRVFRSNVTAGVKWHSFLHNIPVSSLREMHVSIVRPACKATAHNDTELEAWDLARDYAPRNTTLHGIRPVDRV